MIVCGRESFYLHKQVRNLQKIASLDGILMTSLYFQKNPLVELDHLGEIH